MTTIGFIEIDPHTGVCIAAHHMEPPRQERERLYFRGSILEVRRLGDILRVYGECIPSKRIMALGTAVGRYLDCPIPGGFESADGNCFEFVGVFPMASSLRTLEIGLTLLPPGLIYAPVATAARAHPRP